MAHGWSLQRVQSPSGGALTNIFDHVWCEADSEPEELVDDSDILGYPRPCFILRVGLKLCEDLLWHHIEVASDIITTISERSTLAAQGSKLLAAAEETVLTWRAEGATPVMVQSHGLGHPLVEHHFTSAMAPTQARSTKHYIESSKNSEKITTNLKKI